MGKKLNLFFPRLGLTRLQFCKRGRDWKMVIVLSIDDKHHQWKEQLDIGANKKTKKRKIDLDCKWNKQQ
jgi:hypothetical protein